MRISLDDYSKGNVDIDINDKDEFGNIDFIYMRISPNNGVVIKRDVK